MNNQMNINQFTQYFDNPKVSVFPRMAKKGFPMRFGKLYPAYWDLLGFGNSAKGTTGHKLRMAPMLAPNFSDMYLQEHSAVVPLRVIMKDYEAKFNYATNRDGASLPHISISKYNSYLISYLRSGRSVQDSLMDFFGMPTYSFLWKPFITGPKTYIVHNDDPSELSISAYDLVPFSFYENEVLDYSNLYVLFSFSYRGDSFDVDNISALPLVLFALGFSYVPASFYGTKLEDFYRKYASNEDGSISTTIVPTIDQLVEFSEYETVDSLINAYNSYLFSFVIDTYIQSTAFSESSITTLPFRAYWRFFYDWNTNGNFTNRDVLLEERVLNFETTLANLFEDLQTDDNLEKFCDMLSIPNRLWDYDYFMNFLPNSSADDAIEIPANSTVLDLAKLTALQKLALKLSYSSRYRDVVWNIFKIAPSDARLQQSSVIRQKTHNIGVGETIQTSETTTTGVLGGFAGRGYSSGQNRGYHIFCEEPCVLFNFVSLMAHASYRDALHPLVHVDDILDFPIPDMDVLGNQPQYADILSGNPADKDTVLGWGRQYYEWLCNYNTVHGDFKTTLDYWQLTRSFEDTPVINDDILRVHDADDFDQIFSVPNAPHAFLDIYFNAKVTRHVHRSVRIQI